MQPAPQELFSEQNLTTISNVPLQSAQHGIQHDGVPTSGDIRQRGSHTTALVPIPASSPSLESGGRRTGLIDSTDKTQFTRQMITEISASQEDFAHANPEFSTTRLTASTNLEHLPNELLIHTLSHLDPADLLAVALVNKQFFALVTSPDAWRAAFARFFPGPLVIHQTENGLVNADGHANMDTVRTDRRRFCRLTQVSTWREEYVSRAHLLRSLERGRPTQYLVMSNSGPTGQVVQGTPTRMFLTPSLGHITRLSGNFDGSTGEAVSFLHGSNVTSEAVLSSTLGDDQQHPRWSTSAEFDVLRRFNQVHIGDEMWGLGAGLIVGCPNIMDLSRMYGAIYGEGLPNGRIFWRSIHEKATRTLVRADLTTALNAIDLDERPLGVPLVTTALETVTSVWIAKTAAVPSLSNGIVGMLEGSSHGILSAYSLGHPGIRDEHLNRGQVTARWVLSPGVPIVAIAVDEVYSFQRQAQNRIWAFVLNALGEVFYISQMPQRPEISARQSPDETVRDFVSERLAWETGRSVYWRLAEPTRREARPDPYNDLATDGSYSPRSSWKGMCLSPDQIRAETAEIQTFLDRTPKEIQLMCHGWDMRRRLEVDFASDDGNFAGESAIVIGCALDGQDHATIYRFTRCKVKAGDREKSRPASRAFPNGQASGLSSSSTSPERLPPIDEWKAASLTFGKDKLAFSITATALDCSKLATVTLIEDPLASSSNNDISTLRSFISKSEYVIPGQRARFMAVGTNAGSVYLWDVRAALQSNNVEVVPVRIIHTSSPVITSLALTALYLVHGGSDGLVQMWDPLASILDPIRTINGRVSGRTRRRYQLLAGRVPPEWDIDMVGANAVALDPDAHRLRGIVAIGLQIKVWSFRSSNLFGLSGNKSGKRRLRKSATSRRGSTPLTGPRSDLLDTIQDELNDMRADQKERFRERRRLAQRFGVGMLGEDEELQLALMMSTEAFTEDPASMSSESSSKTTPTIEHARGRTQHLNDADLAEAIRRSINDSVVPQTSFSEPVSSPSSPASSSAWNVPIRFGRKQSKRPSTSESSTPPRSMSEASTVAAAAVAARAQEEEDLEMALRLSLEEQGTVQEEFPGLPSSSVGRGKGKARRSS